MKPLIENAFRETGKTISTGRDVEAVREQFEHHDDQTMQALGCCRDELPALKS